MYSELRLIDLFSSTIDLINATMTISQTMEQLIARARSSGDVIAKFDGISDLSQSSLTKPHTDFK